MSLKVMEGQGLKINSILIVGLVLLALLLLPAQAQGSVIDLELGGEGAVSWEINNVKPGDSGIKTIELHNKGTENGMVTIWISGINETDYGNDGANLDNYLLFNLSSKHMETNIDLPSTINEFPQSTTNPKYINIIRLNRDEVINLYWEWEFQMAETPQNDAQGDRLSFNINFILNDFNSSDAENSYMEHDHGNDDNPRLNMTTPAQEELVPVNLMNNTSKNLNHKLSQVEQEHSLLETDLIMNKTSLISSIYSGFSYRNIVILLAGAVMLLWNKRRKTKKEL